MIDLHVTIYVQDAYTSKQTNYRKEFDLPAAPFVGMVLEDHDITFTITNSIIYSTRDRTYYVRIHEREVVGDEKDNSWDTLLLKEGWLKND